MFKRRSPTIRLRLFLVIIFSEFTWMITQPQDVSGTTKDDMGLLSIPGPEIIISERDSEEHLPAVAYNSKHNEYLVVWENDWGGGYHDVYAQRVSGTGQMLSWFALTTVHSQMNPAVAYDPDNDRYLVIWVYDYYGDGSDFDLYGRIIPWNGPDPGYPAFGICGWMDDQGHPSVVYNNVEKQFMVVWKNTDTSGEGVPTYISARKILAEGGFPTPGGDPFILASGDVNRDSPDITYNLNRNEYLVTWDVEIDPSDRDIRGIRLRSDGAPLTGGAAAILGEFIISDYIGANEWTPAVTACSVMDQYLVAWQSDDGTGGTDHAIYARSLTGNAIPGTIYLIEDTVDPELNVDVVCSVTGTRYLLTWQRGKGTPGIRAGFMNYYGNTDPPFWVVYPGEFVVRQFPSIAAGRTSWLVAWEHQLYYGNDLDIHGNLMQYLVNLPVVIR